jgi:hypothetical protein
MTNSHRLSQVAALLARGATLAEATLIHHGRTYGSTEEEREARLPGDDIVSNPSVVTTP